MTVTSPREGTSSVTAYTPAVESWNLRKQIATIYWVDVQWTFPPAAVTSGGRETLTTQVNRQTDGTPLAGWIVRYEVSDGVGGTAEPREVVTDAEGRASVQVSPTAAGAASSKIDMQLVRPANFGGSDSPRLVIGSGSTIINWSGGSTYVPSTSSPLTPVTPSTPSIPTVPTTPPITTTPSTPPPTATPVGPAKLELTVQAPQTSLVGEKLRVVATIRNVGQSPATNVVLTDRFDTGLIFPLDPSRNMIENKGIGTIGPGETRTVPIDLDVSKAGSLCQDVGVEYAGGNPVSQRVCVSAAEPAPQRNASFRVTIDAPGSAKQGQSADIAIVVTNTGEVPLTNVRVTSKYPLAAMTPTPVDAGVEVISDTITHVIERLDVGAKKTFRVSCLLKLSTRVTIFADGTAETSPGGPRIGNSDEAEMDILPSTGTAGPAGSAPPPSTQPLAIGIQIGTAPVVAGETPSLRGGTRVTCLIMVRNTTAAAQTGLAIRVYFPQEITPDLNTLFGPPGTTAKIDATGALEFTPVPSIAAGELLQYNIPVTVNGANSSARIDVQAVSSAAPSPTGVVTKQQNVTILGNRQ